MRVDRTATWISLFASVSTLLCCALPIALVALGMGAAVAALTSSAPVLIVLSTYKGYVFALSALTLSAAAWLAYRAGRSCPTDPAEAALCRRATHWNRRTLWVAAAVWCLGFFAAYLALPLRTALGM